MGDDNRQENRAQEKFSPLTAYFWVRDEFLPAIPCSPSQANILLALAGYGNPDGSSIRPGRLNLIRTTKYDRDTIREAINFWLDHPSGVLVRISQGNGKTHASIFRILLPDTEPKGADQTPLNNKQRGGPDAPLSDKQAERGRERGGKGADHPPIPSTEHQSQNQKKEGAAQTAAPSDQSIALPGWVPIPEWSEFLKFRRQSKKPLNEYGQLLAIKELDRLRQAGHDPAAVLNQSILRGWPGLFPLQKNANSIFGPAGRTAEAQRERLNKNLKNLGFMSDGDEQLPSKTLKN